MSKTFRLILLLSMLLVFVTTIPKGDSFATDLGISPRRSLSNLNQSLSVDVTVTSVMMLNSWQIVLSFDYNMLNCTDAFIPSDSLFAGQTYFSPPPIIDNENGRITIFCGLEGQGSNANGTGKLCTLSFRTTSIGASSLTFMNVMKKTTSGTYLLDPDGQIIPFEAANGAIETIGSGFQANIFAVVKNTQTYNVTIWTNSTIDNFYFDDVSKELGFNATGQTGTNGACIVEIPENLLNGTLIALVNQVGASTFSPIIDALPANGTCCFTYFGFSHSTKNIIIRLTTTGDITGDRRVDISDLARTSAAYGSLPGYPQWNPVADLDHNLKVDIRDLAIVSGSFGHWLQP
jgi:hypothetical protein